MGKRGLWLLVAGWCAATEVFAQTPGTPVILDTFADIRADRRFPGADLVIVGHVSITRETGEETTLPGTSFPAAGLESSIVVQAVVKGDPLIHRVLLHHYRLDVNYRVVGGPSQLHFDPRPPVHYVFFLKREDDQRYAPAGGQTDSSYSVTLLREADSYLVK
jgi:hypothetical protein